MPDKQIQDAVIRHARDDMRAAPGASQITPNEKSLAAALWESVTDPDQYSVLWAEWRRGLKDLQNAVLGPWGGTHEEQGSIANPTPQIVTQEMGGLNTDMSRVITPPPTRDFDAEVAQFAMRVPALREEQEIDR